MYHITFQTDSCESEARVQQYITVPAGTNLHDAAALAGFELRRHCGGNGTCGKCHVVIDQQKVLACQTVIQSNLDVFIPNASLRLVESEPQPKSSRSTNCNHSDSTNFDIALDIGTTMLAAELANLTAVRPNPQRKFGDDVITRIQQVMQNKTALVEMQRLLIAAINEMIDELSEKTGIPPQNISNIVAAGNTVMQSILFGIDPSPLGVSPFQPPVSEFPPRLGGELGLSISGTIEGLPIFGGFVGGDIVAGVLTLPELLSDDATRLLLDIGTNGEIVLAHHGKLFTAATAAGPAFEGAKIEYGTLAVPGAIERVKVESGKVVVATIGNRPAIGICGSGLIDAVAALLEQGIILPNGRLAEGRNKFELVSKSESGISEAIFLTQKDIREVQLATGAIRAGIALLLRENGIVPEAIEKFYVAGGFGQSIRLLSAQRIGLLPAIGVERFVFCGNTSLAGARLVLQNPENRETVLRIVQQSQHCDLATLPDFQKVFAESMQFG